MSYVLIFEEAPYFGVVDLAKAVMCASNGCDRPGESPAHCVEHGEGPEVSTSSVVIVQSGLNNVPKRCNITASMSVLDTLRFCCRPAGVC